MYTKLLGKRGAWVDMTDRTDDKRAAAQPRYHVSNVVAIGANNIEEKRGHAIVVINQIHLWRHR